MLKEFFDSRQCFWAGESIEADDLFALKAMFQDISVLVFLTRLTCFAVLFN